MSTSRTKDISRKILKKQQGPPFGGPFCVCVAGNCRRKKTKGNLKNKISLAFDNDTYSQAR
jgi:hypothetical protein